MNAVGGIIKDKLSLVGWDKIALAIVYGVLAYFLLFEVLTTPIYSDADLDREREIAVEVARDGDFEEALARLKALSHYAKSNQKLWQDYAIVLTWAGKDEKALTLLPKVDLAAAPEYFLNDMLAAATRLDNQYVVAQLSTFLPAPEAIPPTEPPVVEPPAAPLPKQPPPESTLQLIAEDPVSEQQTASQTPDVPVADTEPHSLAAKILGESELEAQAKQLRDERQYEAALSVYQEGIERYPGNYQFNLGEALCLFELNQAALASRKLEKILASYPDARDVKKAWIYVLEGLQNYPAALGLQAQLLPESKKPQADSKAWAHLARLSYSKNRDKWFAAYDRVLAENPNNTWLREDYMIRLSWADSYKKALQQLAFLEWELLTEKAIEAAAYSARNIDPDMALKLYEMGEKRFPNNISFSRGVALVLAEKGEKESALNKLKSIDQTALEIATLMDLAQQYEAGSSYLDAQNIYQKILALKPDSEQAYRGFVMSISRVGLPDLAYEKAQQKAQWFYPRHWREILADRAAMAIRRSQLADADVNQRNQRIDVALQYIDDYDQYLLAFYPEEKNLRENLQLDRLTALSIANRHEQVIHDYEALHDEWPVQPGNDLLVTVANAYLVEHQPDQAEAIASQVLDDKPDHFDALRTRFYALIDLGEYEKAEQVVEKMINTQGVWRYGSKPNIIKQNNRRLAAEMMRAMHPAYSNQVSVSHDALNQLAKKAPANTDIKTQQAVVDLWRGHPEKASFGLQAILANEPDLKAAQIAYAYTLLTLRDYSAAETTINSLNAQYQNDPALKKLNRVWDSHHKHSLRFDAGWGKSSGSGFSSKDFQWELQYTSKRFDHNYRGFARLKHLESDFSGQSPAIERIGAGILFDDTWGGVSVELSQSIETNDPGIGISGYWDVSDVLRFKGSLQSYSDATPVRAFANDISMQSLTAGVIYEPEEKHIYEAGLLFGNFDDGNKRSQLNLRARQTVIVEPRYDVRLHEYLSFQANTEEGAPYYNPEGRSVLGGAVEYNGLISQKYEKHFKHRARFDLALVNETNFGSGMIWGLDYRHFWQKDIDLKWYYGVAVGSGIYDGDSETYQRLFLGGEWRF